MTVEALLPGGSEWLRLMTASKVAAVLGLSPWESPFSLWHRMNGTAPAKPPTEQTERGHYLEPAIAAWWADQHPEYDVQTSPLRFHALNQRHACTVDRELLIGGTVVGGLEVKTAASDDEWGTPGTDEIPPYYRAQTLWQAYVLDVPRIHLAVLTSRLQFREYVIEQDDTDLALIHEAVSAFLDSLDSGTPPPLDGHSETYAVARQLHPDIDGTDVDLDPLLLSIWLGARDLLDAATETEQQYRSQVLEAMGTAKRALMNGTPVAQRIANKSGPYLKPIKTKENAA